MLPSGGANTSQHGRDGGQPARAGPEEPGRDAAELLGCRDGQRRRVSRGGARRSGNNSRKLASHTRWLHFQRLCNDRASLDQNHRLLAGEPGAACLGRRPASCIHRCVDRSRLRSPLPPQALSSAGIRDAHVKKLAYDVLRLGGLSAAADSGSVVSSLKVWLAFQGEGKERGATSRRAQALRQLPAIHLCIVPSLPLWDSHTDVK